MAATGLYASEQWAGVMWGANDIPWMVVAAACFGILLIWECVRTFTRKKEDAPATAGDIQKYLVNDNYQVRELKSAVARLPQKALGTDGATCAELPAKTLIVTRPDGSLVLALPISATLRSGSPRISVTLKGGTEDDG